ncbi:hypothetical protein EXS65_00515 [Candidatus Peribacteria bacterium]|nr:hypothetical protein [Candidatus Peribacteria bacterium]
MKISTLSFPGFDPLDFFSKLDAREKKSAYFTSGEWTIVTWNPTRSIRVKDEKIFEALRRANERRRSTYKGDLPFIGGMIGTLDYDVQERGGVFHEYDQALLWNGTKAVVVGERKFVEEVRNIDSRAPFSPSASALGEGSGMRRGETLWHPSITHSDYARSFRAIQRDLRNGEYYQLNLTYTLEADFNGDRRRLFCDLLRANPASCASYFEDGDIAILSLSPERFVTIDNGTIVTCPIKGTRPRGKTAAEDVKFRNELLSSKKEEAELNMITDLLRNDIGKVSQVGSVKVREHRAFQKNPTVWHTYSVIEGKLLPSVHPVQAIRSMFPGGSVTGCPKAVAMKRIAELEKRPRGSYCGSMVMLSDAGLLDSTILIRTIVAKGNRLSLGIGGGIVADSTLEDEWQETKQKAKAFVALSTRRSLFDPSNPDAYGVFETMRVEHGRVCDLEAHCKRLRKSAAVLKMKLPKSMQEIRMLVIHSAASCRGRPSRLKLVCTPDDVLVDMRPLTINPNEKAGISATFVQCIRALPEGKILPYHREWAAHEKARAQGYGEALLVDATGRVPEAAYANIFWVDDGILNTTDKKMLAGITRGKILQCAKHLNIPVRFSLPTKADLLHADEVFLTKSTTGMTPVISIDKTVIGRGKTGVLTGRLMRAFESSGHVSATL